MLQTRTGNTSAHDLPQLGPFIDATLLLLRVKGKACQANLSEAGKVELQQYITRCYGSLTTFNILFKNNRDQFRISAR